MNSLLLGYFFHLFLRYDLGEAIRYRLPTHGCGAHKKFFDDPFLFCNRNFGQTELIRSAKPTRDIVLVCKQRLPKS